MRKSHCLSIQSEGSVQCRHPIRSEAIVLAVLDAMIKEYEFRWLCASPSREPYKGTFSENGSAIPNAKAT